jgi:hypothetical protein
MEQTTGVEGRGRCSAGQTPLRLQHWAKFGLTCARQTTTLLHTPTTPYSHIRHFTFINVYFILAIVALLETHSRDSNSNLLSDCHTISRRVVQCRCSTDCTAACCVRTGIRSCAGVPFSVGSQSAEFAGAQCVNYAQ